MNEKEKMPPSSSSFLKIPRGVIKDKLLRDESEQFGVKRMRESENIRDKKSNYTSGTRMIFTNDIKVLMHKALSRFSVSLLSPSVNDTHAGMFKLFLHF